MRYMMLYKPGHESCEPPSPECAQAVGRLAQELTAAGIMLATDGLLSSEHGVRVAVRGGDFVLTDGPFAEAKELVGGFAILRCRSKEHAIELSKRFLALMGEGETEIRLMYEGPGDCSAEAADSRGALAGAQA